MATSDLNFYTLICGFVVILVVVPDGSASVRIVN